MESGKFWIFAFFILIVSGGSTLYQHFQGVDRVNADLIDLKNNLFQMESATENLRTEWAKVEALLAKLRVAQAKGGPIQQRKEELQKKIRGLEGEFRYLVSSTRAAVDKVRENAPGEVYPEVNLANGKVFKDAKIRKVEEDQISFIHSDGIGYASFDILPADLLKKFDLGPGGLAVALKNAEQEVFSANRSVVKPKAAATTAAATPEPSNLPVVDEAKVKAVKLKIIDLDARIGAAKSTVASFEKAEKDNSESADSAKLRGTPTSKYLAAVQTAKQQAEAYRKQVIALEAEKRKLEVEIEGVGLR